MGCPVCSAGLPIPGGKEAGSGSGRKEGKRLHRDRALAAEAAGRKMRDWCAE